MVEGKGKADSKRRKHRQNVKPQRTMRVAHGEGRDALLEAVVHVVARDGLGGVSYRSVAKEAGVAHGLVHYYFGSKEEMVGEAFKWAVDTEINEMHLRPEHAWVEDFPERLAGLSKRDANLHLFVNEMVMDACRKPNLRKLIKPLFEEVFETVRKSLEVAGIPASTSRARVIFAAVGGLTVQHLIFGSGELSRESASEFRNILLSLRDQEPVK